MFPAKLSSVFPLCYVKLEHNDHSCSHVRLNGPDSYVAILHSYNVQVCLWMNLVLHFNEKSFTVFMLSVKSLSFTKETEYKNSSILLSTSQLNMSMTNRGSHLLCLRQTKWGRHLWLLSKNVKCEKVKLFRGDSWVVAEKLSKVKANLGRGIICHDEQMTEKCSHWSHQFWNSILSMFVYLDDRVTCLMKLEFKKSGSSFHIDDHWRASILGNVWMGRPRRR